MFEFVMSMWQRLVQSFHVRGHFCQVVSAASTNVTQLHLDLSQCRQCIVYLPETLLTSTATPNEDTCAALKQPRPLKVKKFALIPLKEEEPLHQQESLALPETASNGASNSESSCPKSLSPIFNSTLESEWDGNGVVGSVGLCNSWVYDDRCYDNDLQCIASLSFPGKRRAEDSLTPASSSQPAAFPTPASSSDIIHPDQLDQLLDDIFNDLNSFEGNHCPPSSAMLESQLVDLNEDQLLSMPLLQQQPTPPTCLTDSYPDQLRFLETLTVDEVDAILNANVPTCDNFVSEWPMMEVEEDEENSPRNSGSNRYYDEEDSPPPVSKRMRMSTPTCSSIGKSDNLIVSICQEYEQRERERLRKNKYASKKFREKVKIQHEEAVQTAEELNQSIHLLTRDVQRMDVMLKKCKHLIHTTLASKKKTRT